MTETGDWEIIQGDCLDVLRTQAEGVFDAVVCDPPYELGFMGKRWDGCGIAYNVDMWREVFRVLKPGGHVLAFGGTRTYHRMACAIEDAGFEIRDSLHWITGSGFPKSRNLSKDIDRMAGAEREVVGQRDTLTGMNKETNVFNQSPRLMSITAPATDAAQHWDGWGTALKPSHEPIVLARKPLAEDTVAANVLAHGTGAINVAATRVGLSPQTTNPVCGVADNVPAAVPGSFPGPLDDTSVPVLERVRDALRRIASELRSYNTGGTTHGHNEHVQGDILESAVGYERLLVRLYPNGVWCGLSWNAIPSSQGDCPPCHRSCDGLLRDAQAAAQASPTLLADVLERIGPWLCEPPHSHGCQCSDHPSSCGALAQISAFVRLLTQGNYTTPHIQQPGRWPPNLLLTHAPACNGSCAPTCPVAELDGQSGETKSQRSVRKQAGLSVGNQVTLNTYQMNSDNVGGFDDTGGASRYFPVFRYQAKASRVERSLGLPDGMTSSHPTVKPIDLMRWLCRLITPPGGVVLDPFAGSGTTGCAAVLERFRFVGIEKEAEYVTIARARITYWEKQRPAGIQAALPLGLDEA